MLAHFRDHCTKLYSRVPLKALDCVPYKSSLPHAIERLNCAREFSRKFYGIFLIPHDAFLRTHIRFDVCVQKPTRQILKSIYFTRKCQRVWHLRKY
jgi:hypothetical protein